MTTQPEALRLADDLEAFAAHGGGAMDKQAAAELRRQHAVITDLLEALRLFVDDAHTMTERERLEKARAAIARAERTKP